MRQKKPIEDMAQASLEMEVLSYLPQELRNRLLKIVAIRNSYRYRGPNRHSRLVDNDALPIANLMLDNRRLNEENRKLSIDKAVLDSSNAFYIGLAGGLTQTIKDYRKREEEVTKSVLDSMQRILRQGAFYDEFIDILTMIIENKDDSRDLMLGIIFRFLPDEKSKQAYQLIQAFEKEGWDEVERKKEALEAKIHTESESGRES
jgi:hypothetical protein